MVFSLNEWVYSTDDYTLRIVTPSRDVAIMTLLEFGVTRFEESKLTELTIESSDAY